MSKEIIDFAYLTMCAEYDYIYETGEAKALLNYITNIQQENQQLKEALKNLEEINNDKSNLIVEDMKELLKYKSVLDEIREYIENDQSFIYGVREPNGEFVYKDTVNKEDMIAILDKVKE